MGVGGVGERGYKNYLGMQVAEMVVGGKGLQKR